MPTCKYGDKCYRKNAEHVKECHPEQVNDEEVDETRTVEEPTKKRRRVKEDVDVKGKRRKEEEGDESDSEVLKSGEEVDVEGEGKDENEKDEGDGGHKSARKPSTSPHREPFCTQPAGIYGLWNKARAVDPEDPRCAFSEIDGARLVGFFDFLAGDLNEATDDEIRLHARFSTDLPEMQTFIVTDTGRYALWRDDPKQNQALVVYVKHKEEHFPKIVMIGDKPIHALVHAAGDGAEAMLERFFPIAENAWANIEKIKKDVKISIGRRNKISVGRPLHSMRLWVYVDSNDVGYRSLGEDLNKLKRTLTILGETTDEAVRMKKMGELREIGTTVQLATDECDFGTALEFGHDLFIANYPVLDAMAKRNLKMAYNLLGRKELGAILDAQMADGVRRRRDIGLMEE